MSFKENVRYYLTIVSFCLIFSVIGFVAYAQFLAPGPGPWSQPYSPGHDPILTQYK